MAQHLVLSIITLFLPWGDAYLTFGQPPSSNLSHQERAANGTFASPVNLHLNRSEPLSSSLSPQRSEANGTFASPFSFHANSSQPLSSSLSHQKSVENGSYASPIGFHANGSQPLRSLSHQKIAEKGIYTSPVSLHANSSQPLSSASDQRSAATGTGGVNQSALYNTESKRVLQNLTRAGLGTRKEREVELPKTKTKSKIVLAILSGIVPLGICGCDRCYMGSVGLGVLKCITGGGFGLWALIDFLVIQYNMLSMAKSINAVGFVAMFPAEEVSAGFWIAVLLLAVQLLPAVCGTCMSCMSCCAFLGMQKSMHG